MAVQLTELFRLDQKGSIVYSSRSF